MNEVHTCTIFIGELARGIAALSDGPKRRQQEHHLNHIVLPSFRILPFDLEASLHWGAAMGANVSAPIPPNNDAKIAAIAAARGLTVATGNVRDFAPLGVP